MVANQLRKCLFDEILGNYFWCFAGLAGAYLVIESAGIYRVLDWWRGFIGLASMILGIGNPCIFSSGLFGYADSLQLRSEESAGGLLLPIVLILLLVATCSFFAKIKSAVEHCL